MPKNTAAWLVKTKTPLEEDGAPYTSPREGEIVVRNQAVAINPFDWINQYVTGMSVSWIKLPFVLGSDVAGEVVELGAGVTRFKPGDRVLGHPLGVDKKRNRAAEGAFQQYTVLLAHMASPIPDSLSYESASVLPLAFRRHPAVFFKRINWLSSFHRTTRGRLVRHCWSGADQRVLGVMRFNLRSRPGTRSLRLPRRPTSRT